MADSALMGWVTRALRVARLHTHSGADQDSGIRLDHGTAMTAASLADDDHPQYVLKTLFDAQTIIAATSDNTPAAVTVNEQTLVGRITGGNITALTPAQARSLLDVAGGDIVCFEDGVVCHNDEVVYN